jgi:glycosyltransferase involved in cell wall biosynthesis
LTSHAPGRALLVSSFVRPHPGGVEEFVDYARMLLEEQGWEVRTLACRLPGLDDSADAVVPARFLGGSSWPLPTGGLHTLWREVGAGDVVIANGARHLLSVLAVLAATARRRGALLVIHGSGEGPYAGPGGFRFGRALFERTLGLVAARLAQPVSVSRVGVEGARRMYGVAASYFPYPVRDLPPVSEPPLLSADEPMRVAWVGRLFPEKDPLVAVEAIDVVRREREAVLHVCGDGPLRPELERLATRRPWLVLHGALGWEDVQAVQGSGHACLATSVADNVQVALLEALCRGIPTVSTRVGDAPAYYDRPAIRHLCVEPRDPEAVAHALLDLAAAYESYRPEFAANAAVLTERHAAAGAALASVAAAAVRRPRRGLTWRAHGQS